ncbi:MAG: hypothetical protein ACOC7S_00665 [Planctomycetota bacterium]
MDGEERELAEAAAGLTADDFRYLEKNGMLEENTDPGEPADTQEAPSEGASSENAPSEEGPSDEATSHQEPSEGSRETQRKRKRRRVKHEWPEVGAVLEADYMGTRYEAEVIEAPRYKSGKAIRILTGPAAGEVERSMSGAMLKATEKQREAGELGRKGVANGWDFWKVKEEGDEDVSS